MSVRPTDNAPHASDIVAPDPLNLWLSQLDHDRIRRAELVAAINSHQTHYTALEKALLDKGHAMLRAQSTGPESPARRASSAGSLSNVDSSLSASATRRMRVKEKHTATIDRWQTVHDREEDCTIGQTDLTMRGVTPQEVIAMLMDFNSRFFESRFDPATDVRNEIREYVNAHHIVTYVEKRNPALLNRTFLNALIYKQLAEHPPTFIWVCMPIASHPSVNPSRDEANKLRAEVARVFLVTGVSGTVCKVKYACRLDLKGRVPTYLTSNVAIPYMMRLPCAPSRVPTTS